MELLAPADAITVICVAETPAIASAGMESGFTGGVATAAEVDAAWVSANAGATAALERTLAALPSSATVESEIERGAPGPAMCQRAGALGADVVVVGSRGLGAIRHALLGSVSTYVVNNAPCPVVVVRAGTDQ